ncbi:MAG: hypothetical protein F6K47_00795 [Symploca sp. SIO2E6]|nr:hypothetical protein [Symploca sp. SIO2E6]
MTENLEPTAIETEDTAQEAEPVTPQSIAEVITELEEYRERLLKDMTKVAKKAKLPKSTLMTQLKPELAKIETALTELRTQHTALTSGN